MGRPLVHQQQRIPMQTSGGEIPPQDPWLAAGDMGPDVSSYQPNVDWSAVAASGQRFAFVKATEGITYLNPYYRRDWQAIADVGMVRGTYHFGRPDSNTAEVEAAWFCSQLGELRDDDMLVLDLEDGMGDLLDWTMRFVSQVRAITQLQAWLYTGGPFMREHHLEVPQLAQACRGLWLAAYQANPPPVPIGWPRIDFWQFTSSATIPGIAGGCDQSVYLP